MPSSQPGTERTWTHSHPVGLRQGDESRSGSDPRPPEPYAGAGRPVNGGESSSAVPSYDRFAHAISQVRHLTRAQFVIFSALWLFADRDTGVCYPARTTLGRVSGLDRKTMRLAITRLVELGLLEVAYPAHVARRQNTAVSSRTSTTYRIAPNARVGDCRDLQRGRDTRVRGEVARSTTIVPPRLCDPHVPEISEQARVAAKESVSKIIRLDSEWRGVAEQLAAETYCAHDDEGFDAAIQAAAQRARTRPPSTGIGRPMSFGPAFCHYLSHDGCRSRQAESKDSTRGASEPKDLRA